MKSNLKFSYFYFLLTLNLNILSANADILKISIVGKQAELLYKSLQISINWEERYPEIFARQNEFEKFAQQYASSKSSDKILNLLSYKQGDHYSCLKFEKSVYRCDFKIADPSRGRVPLTDNERKAQIYQYAKELKEVSVSSLESLHVKPLQN